MAFILLLSGTVLYFLNQLSSQVRGVLQNGVRFFRRFRRTVTRAARESVGFEGGESSGGQRLRAFEWVILTFVALSFVMLAIVVFDDRRDAGEPFTLRSGSSVWPSVCLLFACTGLAVIGFFHVQDRLKGEGENITRLRRVLDERGDNRQELDSYMDDLRGGTLFPVLLTTGLLALGAALLFAIAEFVPEPPARGLLVRATAHIVQFVAGTAVLVLSCQGAFWVNSARTTDPRASVVGESVRRVR